MKNNVYVRLLPLLSINVLFLVSLINDARGEGDRIIAIVNDDIITESEIHPSQIFPNKSISFLIEKKLQLQIAKKRGISISQQEISSAIEDIKRKGSFKTDRDFEESLQKEGISIEAFKRDLKEQLTLVKLINREIGSKISLSNEEMERYYLSHKERFLLPEEIRIGSIYIPFKSSDSVDSIQQVRNIMKDILADLKNNVSFEDIKEKYSKSLQVYVDSDIGFVKKGELMKELDRVVFDLGVGDVSEPIETPGGIYIIKVLEKKERDFIPFQDARNIVEDMLFQEKSEKIYRDWIYEIKSTAYIEIL